MLLSKVRPSISKIQSAWRPFLLLVGLVACFSVFLLPYAFPPRAFVLSASYMAGFNNRVAACSAIMLSVFVFIAAPANSSSSSWLEKSTTWTMPRRYLWIVLAIFVLFQSVLAWCVYSSRHPYAEESYGLDRFYQLSVLHRVPLRDFEFGYGPILLYVPLLIKAIGSPFHLNLEASYLISVICMHLAGIAILFYVVNRMIPDRAYKAVVFFFLAFCSLNIDFGVQYTGIRFFGPYAVLLAAGRFSKAWQVGLLFALSGSVFVLISPEIGIAFVFGACTYSILRSREQGPVWFFCALASCIGLILDFLTFGAAVFRSISSVAAGALNFVVVPVPHILLFLAAVIFVVPVGIAAIWNRGEPKTTFCSSLIAIYVASLMLVPSALGRCDGGHVLFEGFGFFLLSLLFVGRYVRRYRNLWLSGFIVIYLLEYGAHIRMYGRLVAETARSGLHALPAVIERKQTIRALQARLKTSVPVRTSLDFDKLAATIGNGSVVAPLLLDKESEYVLKRSPGYQPNFFANLNFVTSSKDEDIIITEVDQAVWVVLPSVEELPLQEIDSVRHVFLFPLYYPEWRDEYQSGLRTIDHVKKNFVKVSDLGSYALYRNSRVAISLK